MWAWPALEQMRRDAVMQGCKDGASAAGAYMHAAPDALCMRLEALTLPSASCKQHWPGCGEVGRAAGRCRRQRSGRQRSGGAAVLIKAPARGTPQSTQSLHIHPATMQSTLANRGAALSLPSSGRRQQPTRARGTLAVRSLAVPDQYGCADEPNRRVVPPLRRRSAAHRSAPRSAACTPPHPLLSLHAAT